VPIKATFRDGGCERRGKHVQNGATLLDAQRRLKEIDDALAAGQLAEQAWYEQVRELIEDAYLAADGPEGQSGLGGDAAHWKQRRGVLVEAIDRDGTFLDVGCANGLLMETLVAWADHFILGNVIAWEPDRRFNFVFSALEYVPQARQPELVSRLLGLVVAPGGRRVLCAYRPRGSRGAEPIEEHLNAWDFTVSGRASAIDPVDGGVATRVVWLDADR
jgi:hypothetical protein